MIAAKAFLPGRGRMMSWREASARERLRYLLDPSSFVEFLGPEEREISPHLKSLNLPSQFDDGIIVGRGLLNGMTVFGAAQEGRFSSGSIGEVHGAKLTGLLRAARDIGGIPLLIFFDTSGVRPLEANLSELAIADIMRAAIEARHAGVEIVGLIGGSAGCYGGGSLVAGCCSALAASEHGYIAYSTPKAIEDEQGTEIFNSRDSNVVRQTIGGRHRRLIGGLEAFVDDSINDFRHAAIQLLRLSSGFDVHTLKAEQIRLEDRLHRFGACKDAIEVWQAEGVRDPQGVSALSTDDFVALADKVWRTTHDAR